MKKPGLAYALTALGFILLAMGLWLLRLRAGGGVIPYFCIGIGCGVFGHGAGELLSQYSFKKNPDLARLHEIEEKDERNVALRNRAQAKAYSIMQPLFGALLIAFGLMGVEIRVILLLVAAYLFVCGCAVYYRFKFEKEM